MRLQLQYIIFQPNPRHQLMLLKQSQKIAALHKDLKTGAKNPLNPGLGLPGSLGPTSPRLLRNPAVLRNKPLLQYSKGLRLANKNNKVNLDNAPIPRPDFIEPFHSPKEDFYTKYPHLGPTQSPLPTEPARTGW